jgi:HD domain-containing protein
MYLESFYKMLAGEGGTAKTTPHAGSMRVTALAPAQLLTGRITVDGLVTPLWGGLVAELVATRPRTDAELIERACEVAARCHQGQLRRSGDPYITHPVAAATILARLDDAGEVDDQALCAAILHGTVVHTSYTLAAMRHDFGAGIAAMVAGHMALHHLGEPPGRQGRHVMAAVTSADARVITVKLAERLHNMQTLQYLPHAKQMRKARAVLDTFLPVAGQLGMPTLQSQLQAHAVAALIRNQPIRPPRRRVIVALDIEGSTTRPDPAKAELRTMIYELFDAALRSAGITAQRRDRFADRGDGLLALIDPADQALLLSFALPAFSRLLAGYNASLPDPAGRDRRLRVRVVVHCGNVHDDDNGCFGEALDIAFRLLDAPSVKEALKMAHGAVLLVVSSDIHDLSSSCSSDIAGYAASRPVTVRVAGNDHQGWIHVPAEAA